jgi:hypothetical protein
VSAAPPRSSRGMSARRTRKSAGPWQCPGNVRDLSKVVVSPRPRQAGWHIRVHNQSTSSETGHPQTVHVPELSAVSPHPFLDYTQSRPSPVPRHLGGRSAKSSFPCPVSVHVATSTKPNPLMSSFDPVSVRQAVAEFTPRRPQRFQELVAAREVIVELRQKRASYRAIAELLTQHCLPISKTAVAAFCHEVLGELVRSRRRPGRKRLASADSPSTGFAGNARPTSTTELVSAPTPISDSETNLARPARQRGPRIAQVRMVSPPNA